MRNGWHGIVLQLLSTLAMLCGSAAACAQVIDVYEYADDTIYTVKTGLGITTSIELRPDDRVLDYSTGFTTGWELTRRENVFYLKPRDVDVDTNLLVRTERRAYIFELQVVTTDWTTLDQAKRDGVQYRVRFRYAPADPTGSQVEGPAASADAPMSDADRVEPESLHFGYEFATRSRGAGFVPLNVHDDGRFTYIRMPPAVSFPSGRFPAVFARLSERADDFVVNSTVEGDTIVVHGTYPFLVMRQGGDVVGLRRSGE